MNETAGRSTDSRIEAALQEYLDRIDRGEVVDPQSYYFRIAPLFETSAPHYDWINHVVGIGIGHRLADGPIYSIFELL